MQTSAIALPTHSSQTDHDQVSAKYARHVNKPWVKLLNVLGMNVPYSRCQGNELWTADGECYTDFMSGYCVHNVGHNHPQIIAALTDELQQERPKILQSLVPDLAAELAARLCKLAGGGLNKVYFSNTGSEGIETVIKFARAHTKRTGMLFCEGSFHGLSYGAMSLMKDPAWCDGFGPFLPGTDSVPYLDLEALEEKLATKRYAAFVVEPIQSESGIQIPGPGVLKEAQRLCNKHDTLFVLDEVQTGMYRTGTFLAAHQFDVEPDMVVLAKALSGGMMPVGAVLMREEICNSIYSSIDRAFIHASTFGENGLSMRAGLTTLDVIEQENIAARCIQMGEYLREKVLELAPRYEMLAGVRGMGLMNGVVFQPPTSFRLKALYKPLQFFHEGLFGQIMVMRLFREGKILTQMCGKAYNVIKASPTLVVSKDDIDQFVLGLDQALTAFHSGKGFKDGLTIAKRIFVK